MLDKRIIKIDKASFIDIDLMLLAIKNVINDTITKTDFKIECSHLTADDLYHYFYEISSGITNRTTILLNEISDLFKEGGNALFLMPLNISNLHYTLLALAKKDDEYKALYIDSNGDFQYTLGIDNKNQVAVSVMIKEFCQVVKANNDLPEISFTEKVGEVYQHNNDCAVQVLEAAKIIIEMVDDFRHFDSSAFWARAIVNKLHKAEAMTLKRYYFALGLKNSGIEEKMAFNIEIGSDLLRLINKISNTIATPIVAPVGDFRNQLSCGNAKIDLRNLIALIRKSGAKLTNASGRDTFLVVGESRSGKSVSIAYLLENLLKRVNNGDVGLDHGPGLKLVYQTDPNDVKIKIDSWKETGEVGHILAAPFFNEEGKISGWKLILIINKEKETVERTLTSSQVRDLGLRRFQDASRKKPEDFDFDSIFYFIRDNNIFQGYQLNCSHYLNKIFPEFKTSINSQTTIAETYIGDVVVTDCAGFGDTRVAELLETGNVTNGTAEEALMTTMSMKMTIDNAKSIKGLVLVVTPGQVTERGGRPLLNLLKTLVNSMPDLHDIDQITALADSLVIVVSKISAHGNELDEQAIEKFGDTVKHIRDEVEGQVNKLIKENMQEIKKGGVTEYLSNAAQIFNITSENKIEEFKRKIKKDAFFIPNNGILAMLNIINKKIDNDEIIYIHPTDRGESRAKLINQLLSVSKCIEKEKFQFLGANKVHEAFISSAALIGTHASEYLSKRDHEIPLQISTLEKEKEAKQLIFKSIKDREELLNKSIENGAVNLKEIIRSTNEQIEDYNKQMKLKKEQKKLLGTERVVLENDIFNLQNDCTIVDSEWEKTFSDKREKTNGIRKLFSFVDNSEFTVEQKFDHPYEEMTVTYGYGSPQEVKDWVRYLKVTKDIKETGEYQATYKCDSWWEKHPILIFRAKIQNKYHSITLNKIKLADDKLKIIDAKIAELDREINDLIEKINIKTIQRDTTNKDNIEEINKNNLAETRKERDILSEDLKRIENAIKQAKLNLIAIQKDINDEYPTFEAIRDISEITKINIPIITSFIKQFHLLKREITEEEISSEKVNAKLENSSFVKTPASPLVQLSHFFKPEQSTTKSPLITNFIDIKMSLDKAIRSNDIDKIQKINKKLELAVEELDKAIEDKTKQIEDLELERSQLLVTQEHHKSAKNECSELLAKSYENAAKKI